MRELHERPRPLPHLGSAAGEPRFSHWLSPRVLIFSMCAAGFEGRPASGEAGSAARPLDAAKAKVARLPCRRKVRRSSCRFMGVLLRWEGLLPRNAALYSSRVSGYDHSQSVRSQEPLLVISMDPLFAPVLVGLRWPSWRKPRLY